ncbi:MULTISPECIES: Fe-S cluster assembly protein SufB [Thermococcus]|uniref:SufB FeS assembly protein SufB n=1 Tax=Thermococcus sibiricus (strain DSM 12597 / MM 739) TaxID=604354 RepID=C6A576_THESM|nr:MULTISPECIES: Fe-S cluster assembly protein SufB [Thermococcus]ACS90771.1 SufB; FeS assembly protein SufB [Thermococcus sibiricus MM 739]MBC7094207.1 Fe-S cluster assembly protein SufB [Thermococcus sp.]
MSDQSKLEEILKAGSLEEILGTAVPYPKEIELKGKISRDTVEELSRIKKEPEWMLRHRLRALEVFEKLPMPKWVVGIEELDLDNLILYTKPELQKEVKDWDDLPENIRKTFERLNIPEIEKKFLSGLTAVFDSESVYSQLKEEFEKKGIIMLPMEEAVKKYPDLVKKYFGKVFPPGEHKFSALHHALWSGGAFVYIPKGVRVPFPIEAFFVIGSALEGQFEHTLLVADEGSYVHFIEGCSAPMYKGFSFHDGMVEIYAHKNATVKFTTIQNWSRNVINFNNKRAIIEDNAYVEWIEGSIGSMITYTYPSSVLKGDYSRTAQYVVSLSNGPFMKDTGAKSFHVGKNTSSKIVSKSISANGGINIYRGLVRIARGAENSTATVSCDSLILDGESRAYTYPHNQNDEPSASIIHEATTGKLSEDKLFYLNARGIKEEEAKSLIVLGFISEILEGLPFEYVEVLKKVIELEFSEVGGVG